MPKGSLLKKIYLTSNGLFCLFVLYFPILTLFVYSFNASQGTLTWGGFTLHWFAAIFQNSTIMDALGRSVELALVSALLATPLGLMMALGLRKMSQRLAQRYESLLILPMLVPEIVSAVGLLMTFSKVYRPLLSDLGIGQSSLVSLVAGHLTFSLAYVVVVVKARLSHLDPTLELVSQNLGASRLQTFWWVILPQLLPAVICAFLLVFTLSLDDFYLSHFLTYGGSGYTTLPVYLFGLQARSGLTPEMNAVASLMMLVSIALIGLTTVFYGQWFGKGAAKHAQ